MMFEHRLWNGNALLTHTGHKTFTSLLVEVATSRARREKGEATRVEVFMGPLVGWKEVWHENDLVEHK